jgi:glycosyl transferase family 87
VNGVNPYGPAIRQMHAQLVGIPVDRTFPYFPHPPFSVFLTFFAAFMPFKDAVLTWFAISVALVFVLAAILAKSLLPDAGERDQNAFAFWLFAGLMMWPPVLYNLEKGQWSILLAVMIAAGWHALFRGRAAGTGAWIGVAASTKIFPVLLGGYLLLRARRSVVWFLAAGLLTTGIPLLVVGFDSVPALLRNSRLNMEYWQVFPSVMFSLRGLFARLFIGGEWARPLFHAPLLARVMEAIAVIILASITLRTTVKVRADASVEQRGAVFAAWVALLPILNPQSMGHNGILLAVPFVLTGRALARDFRTWPKVSWALALALVSIPRQTLLHLVPAPSGPLDAVAVLSLPLWGGLLCFAAAVGAADSPEPVAVERCVNAG